MNTIKVIKRNWAEIKRCMLLSNKACKGWIWYSQVICSGLSNHILTTSGTGQLQDFVEKLPYYAQNTSDQKVIIPCTCKNALEFSNCDKNCERRIDELEEEKQHSPALRYGYNLSDEQIKFIEENKEFLKSIKY